MGIYYYAAKGRRTMIHDLGVAKFEAYEIDFVGKAGCCDTDKICNKATKFWEGKEQTEHYFVKNEDNPDTAWLFKGQLPEISKVSIDLQTLTEIGRIHKVKGKWHITYGA